jgi:hypothetical protein
MYSIALDGVVHMPAPVVLAHVAERGADAALGGGGVAAGREHLGEAGGREAGLAHAEHGAEPGPAGADDDDVVSVRLHRRQRAHSPILSPLAKT